MIKQRKNYDMKIVIEYTSTRFHVANLEEEDNYAKEVGHVPSQSEDVHDCSNPLRFDSLLSFCREDLKNHCSFVSSASL